MLFFFFFFKKNKKSDREIYKKERSIIHSLVERERELKGESERA